jgi:hypothetical protein
MVTCSLTELENARRINPERLADAQLIKRINDSVSQYKVTFYLDVLPILGGISTGNWEAARFSGVLAYLDHERITQLSQVYDWTTKRVGVTDEEFAKNLVTLSKYDNVDKLLDDFRLIMKASEMKHSNMKRHYEQIKW